jgi:simple sugar transport system substrate-binding protein
VPIPEVISGINATMIGAQTINPNIKVKIIWVGEWFNPGNEADAAKALIDQGADVIMQHTDSAAAVETAAKRGIPAFGQDSDMIKFGPKTQLTAIIDNWGPYYTERAKLALDGKWTSTDTWGGLGSKMVVMAPYTNMPDDVKKLAEDTEAQIASGKLHPFKCPVVAQDGSTVECKGGTHLDDGQILGMNYYVKGVDDKVPGK